ncbi:hypothetical protein LVT79_25910, partial [Klebsiella pneumoniae]|nr:hypothetical protein [Klebsiella pneumoniae]
GLAIDQIAQSGLSSLSVIYYSAQLFSNSCFLLFFPFHRFLQSKVNNCGALITSHLLLRMYYMHAE